MKSPRRYCITAGSVVQCKKTKPRLRGGNGQREDTSMAVYTETRTYHTKAHMGMIDVTQDFQHAVTEAC